MKKTISRLTKRIMALSLSLIMMFGIIPCNIASAEDIIETGSDWSILAKYMDTTKVPGLDYTIVKNSKGDQLFDVEDVYYYRFITLLSDIKVSDSEDEDALNVKTSDFIDFNLNGHILDRGLIKPDGTIKKTIMEALLI